MEQEKNKLKLKINCEQKKENNHEKSDKDRIMEHSITIENR